MAKDTGLEDVAARALGSLYQLNDHDVLGLLTAVKHLETVAQDLAGGFEDGFTVITGQNLPYLKIT